MYGCTEARTDFPPEGAASVYEASTTLPVPTAESVVNSLPSWSDASACSVQGVSFRVGG